MLSSYADGLTLLAILSRTMDGNNDSFSLTIQILQDLEGIFQS